MEMKTVSKNWQHMKLADFVEIQRGHDLPERNRKFGNIPIMGSFGITGYHNIAKVKGPGVTIGRSGASIGVVCYMPDDYWPLNTALYVTDFHGNDERFTYYFLQTLNLTNHNSGSAQPSLNRNYIYPMPIKVPSLSEQQAIATALSDVDALITSLDSLIAKKRDIKQATMQQLLTGKVRLPGFSKELEPANKQTEVGVIPEKWEECSLGDVVVKVGSGITPTGGEKVYKKEGHPFLRSQNVGWGSLLLDDIAFIDEKTHNSFSETEIKIGDVLLNITGASIGRSAVADNRLLKGNVNQHVCIIRADQDKLNPYYLNSFLLSEMGQKQIESFQAGGNRQGLNFGQIKSFRLPLPSLSEQQAIATVLSDMDAEITSLEQKRDKVRALKQGMMQELLTGKTRLL